MKTTTLALFLFFIFNISFSQDISSITSTANEPKGNFYMTWGYHRDRYTRSSIEFVNHNNNNNYDFTIHNAAANDQLDMKDLLHRPISVPQYSFNLGYFFNDKNDLGIEFSWDHLKYVVTKNQLVHVTGNINGVDYDTYRNIDSNFVRFEHTNGNNYCMINFVKRQSLLESRDRNHKISAIGKLGFGGLIPKTDSYILGKHNDGPFQLSGFVVGAFVGIRYDIFRYFFLEASSKGAFADYTNVIIHDKGRAKHTFWSIQYIASFGVNIPLQKL